MRVLSASNAAAREEDVGRRGSIHIRPPLLEQQTNASFFPFPQSLQAGSAAPAVHIVCGATLDGPTDRQSSKQEQHARLAVLIAISNPDTNSESAMMLLIGMSCVGNKSRFTFAGILVSGASDVVSLGQTPAVAASGCGTCNKRPPLLVPEQGMRMLPCPFAWPASPARVPASLKLRRFSYLSPTAGNASLCVGQSRDRMTCAGDEARPPRFLLLLSPHSSAYLGICAQTLPSKEALTPAPPKMRVQFLALRPSPISPAQGSLKAYMPRAGLLSPAWLSFVSLHFAPTGTARAETYLVWLTTLSVHGCACPSLTYGRLARTVRSARP